MVRYTAKIGIMIHWGVYSVPSYHSEWFWSDWKTNKYSAVSKFMQDHYPKGFSYQEFAKDFSAELWNPDEWADMFKNSGAQYVVLSSKHHEGYTLSPSKYSPNWNAKDVGPHRDLVGDLGDAVRRKGLRFGLYHSLYEWFHSLCLSDKASNFTQTVFVDEKVLPEMYEIVEKYKPEVLWSDGDERAPSVYWRAEKFIAWLYNDSPVKDTIVVNDQWGLDAQNRHGYFKYVRANSFRRNTTT